MNGPGFTGVEIPPPIDWQAFERLCRDLWAAIWNDANTRLNGRSGQPQSGVDVFGQPGGHGPFAGVQCKRRSGAPDPNELSEDELRAEVEKAKTFTPRISEFVLATTGRRDAKLQAVARTICLEHEQSGLFRVSVVSWDDIQELLGQHSEVALSHYSSLLSSAVSLAARADPEWVARTLVASTAGSIVLAALGAAPDLQAEFSAELDVIWALVKKRQPGLALEQAEALKARVWHRANDATRGRILTIAGYAAVEAGHIDDGAKLLVEAATVDSSSARCVAAAALGHSMLGNMSAAKEWSARALKLDESNLVAIQVAILQDPRDDVDIVAEFESKVGRRFEVYGALGHRAWKAGDHNRASEWFEKALELEADNPEMLAAAGQCVVDGIAHRLESRFNLTSADLARLKDASAKLEKAWSVTSDPHMRLGRAGWLHSRVIAARFLQRAEVATLAEELVALDPKRPEFLRVRAAVASDSSDHGAVIRILEGIAQLEPDDLGLLATAHANIGAFDLSINCWRRLLDAPDLPATLRMDARRNYCLTLIEADRKADAKRFASDLVRDQADLSALLVAATVAEGIDDRHWRDELLGEIQRLSTEDQPAYALLIAGNQLARAGDTDEAIKIYRHVVDCKHDSPYTRKLTELLAQAGQVAQALEICATVIQNDGQSPFYVESTSLIHEQLGNLSTARSVCETFLREKPDSVAVRLRLATILQRMGEEDAARGELDRIPINEVIGSPGQALHLARLLAGQDRPDTALEVLYRTRRLHPGDADVHLQYFAAHAQLGRELSDPEEVALGTAVEIVGNGAPGWMLICERGEQPASIREYSLEHPLVKAALGKKVGDQVSFAENPNHNWKIASISSKHAFAYRETMETFFARFPTARGIEQHEVPADTSLFLKQIKERLEEGEPRNQQVEELYLRGHMTVGAIARVLHRSSIDALGFVVAMPSGLQAFSNTAEEKRQSLERLQDSSVPLILDMTALVTLEMLGVLRDGTLAGRKLIVAQTTVDELQAEHFRWRTTPKEGFMSIGIRDGELVRSDASPEDVERLASHYRALTAWVRANGTVVGVSPALAEGNRRKQARELLGASYWDSLLVAKEHGTLLSDDLRLRQLAQGEFDVPGVCSAALILAEAQGGDLSDARFADCMLTLLLSGYRAVPTDARVLLAAAKRDGWAVERSVRATAATLEGPGVETGSAVSVAVQFFRALWLGPVPEQHRLALVFAILDALAVGRDIPLMIQAVENQTRAAFHLLPIASPEVLGLVARWREVRLR